jgi:hypothetical protein
MYGISIIKDGISESRKLRRVTSAGRLMTLASRSSEVPASQTGK